MRRWCSMQRCGNRAKAREFRADDLPLYVAALRTHDRWWKGAWLRMIGCTEAELRAILDAIRDSLSERPLTREQLADEVARRVGPHARERMLSGWGEMLKPAAFQGSLLFGPPQGQSVTFVRPDAWLPSWKELDSGQAWREIVRRYLHAYGPVAREELGRWWGMQPAPAGRVLAASADQLVAVDVEGYRAWALAEDVAGMQAASPRAPARLLGDSTCTWPGPGRRGRWSIGASRTASSGRRAGSRRWCWWTGWWPGSGATSGRAGASRSRSSRSSG
jgi:hypothetical protein